MHLNKIRAAVKTAQEFIRLAEKLEVEEQKREGYSAPKERGALRRKSMDLTRALAEMRRPG